MFSFADEMTYVNLQLNPERYTGYSGPSARRIWDAIYSENCPKCEIISSDTSIMLAYELLKDDCMILFIPT